jgi:hypothetical protein
MLGYMNSGEQVLLRPIMSGGDADTACREGKLVVLMANGKFYRCRSNGRLRTWVRRPVAFVLPVKIGLRTHHHVTDRDMMDRYFMIREG